MAALSSDRNPKSRMNRRERKPSSLPRGLETLTVIVQDDFENFHGQEPRFVGAKRPAFVMGLAGCVPVKEPEDDETVLTSDTSSLVWHLVRVKSFRDVIEGEHWKGFGFRYSAK